MSASGSNSDGGVPVVRVNLRVGGGGSRLLNFRWGVGDELLLFSSLNKDQRYSFDVATQINNETQVLKNIYINNKNNLGTGGGGGGVSSRTSTSTNTSYYMNAQSISSKLLTISTQLSSLLQSSSRGNSGLFTLSKELVAGVQALQSVKNSGASSQQLDTEILNVCTIGQRLSELFIKHFTQTKRFSVKDSEVVNLKWNTFLPETRKLICESHGYFLQIQKRSANMDDDSQMQDHLLQISKHFRAIITAQVILLQQSRALHTTSFQEYDNQVQLFQIANLVWHLTEIFFINPKPNATLQLVEWFNLHFENQQIATLHQILQTQQPEKHSSYWNLLYKFLLQGQFRYARDLLTQHSQYSVGSEPLSAIEALLRAVPIQEIADLPIAFKKWQEKCSDIRRSRPDFLAEKPIAVVFGILCGDEDQLVRLTDAWYELLLAKLLYKEPGVRKYDIRYIAAQCTEHYPLLTALDRILLSVIDLNAIQVINDSAAFFGNWWLSTHMIDILFHSGALEITHTKSGINLRDYYLQEYALSLFWNRSLWQISITYLLASNTPASRAYLATIVERQVLDSNVKVIKLLSLCDSCKLEEQSGLIHKIVGMKRFKEGRFGSSLSWFLKGKDSARLTQISRKMLDNYLITGTVADIEALLEKLDPNFPFSDKLAFMEKYRALQLMKKRGDKSGFCSLTLKLLATKAAPQQFVLKLLSDLVGTTATTEEARFSSTDDVYILLHSLEEVMLSPHQLQFLTQNNISAKDVDRIRFKLTLALTNSIVNYTQ